MSIKKIIAIILAIIGILLIGFGLSKVIFNNNSNGNEPKVVKKTLRKISLEELNDDTAKEIIQFYLDEKEPNEHWNVEIASLAATDGNNGFLVDVQAKKNNSNWYRQTTLKYDNENWIVDLPMWTNGDKDVSSYSTFFAKEE